MYLHLPPSVVPRPRGGHLGRRGQSVPKNGTCDPGIISLSQGSHWDQWYLYPVGIRHPVSEVATVPPPPPGSTFSKSVTTIHQRYLCPNHYVPQWNLCPSGCIGFWYLCRSPKLPQYHPPLLPHEIPETRTDRERGGGCAGESTNLLTPVPHTSPGGLKWTHTLDPTCSLDGGGCGRGPGGRGATRALTPTSKVSVTAFAPGPKTLLTVPFVGNRTRVGPGSLGGGKNPEVKREEPPPESQESTSRSRGRGKDKD